MRYTPVPYHMWKESDAFLLSLIGTEIESGWLLVELDEATQGRFYDRRFAPLQIIQKYQSPSDDNPFFRIYLASSDDGCLSMWWSYGKMNLYPYEAEQKLLEWLKRTNYFVNLAGLEDFCIRVIGKPDSLSYD